MSIVFYLGYASIAAQNYGSELALVNLALRLKKWYKVYLLSLTGDTREKSGIDLDFITPQQYVNQQYDCIIVSRYINFYLHLPVRAPKVYIWLHDVGLQAAAAGIYLPDSGRWLLDNVMYDGLICQTEWHRKTFIQYYPESKDRLTIIGNGIVTERFRPKLMPQRIPYRFIWTSSPKRGLSYLLKIFPGIQARYPEAQLFIFRGPEEFTEEQNTTIKQLHPIVFYKGLCDNAALANEFLQADVWLYPTDFSETFCISAVEAQAAGCLCICSRLAALEDIVGNRGVLLSNTVPYGSEEYTREVFAGLAHLFAHRQEYSERARQWGLEQDWDNRAVRWKNLLKVNTAPQSYQLGATPPVLTPPVPFGASQTGASTNIIVSKSPITLLCNWTNDLPKEWNKMLRKENLWTFTTQESKGVPLVAINGIPGRAKSADVVHLTMEPASNRGHVPWREDGRNYHNLIEWHLDLAVHHLLECEIPKNKDLSAIISGQRRLDGHQKRLALLGFLDEHLEFDLYGKDSLQLRSYRGIIGKKNAGLLPYRYHFAAENSSEPGYFTEKLVDAILSECLCFYWGCPDIDKYIDPRAYIVLPITDHAKCLKIITDAIADKQYEKRLPYIRNEKRRILKGWNATEDIPRYVTGTKINNLFDIFVVNLARRFDRWERITSTFLGLPYRRLEAVDGQELRCSDELLYQFGNRGYPQKNPYGGHNFRKGVLGCALSHLQAWKRVVELGKPTLVFEDDVVLPSDFSKKWNELSQYLTSPEVLPKWDILFLGFTDDRDIFRDATLTKVADFEVMHFNPLAVRTHGGGTYGYAITPLGAKKILALSQQFGIPQPIDWFMIEMFSFLNVWKLRPHLVTHLDMADTNIQRQDDRVV